MAYDKSVKDQKNKYQNPIPTAMAGFKDMPEIIKRYRKSDSRLRKPNKTIPVNFLKPIMLDNPASQKLIIYWLGHTSLIMEMGGRRYLMDPVLSDRASMVDFAGPKRHHPSPIAIHNLRNIDAVILSHDHYDHMDYKTIKHLINLGTMFYVPLDLGKILLKWGAKAENIVERDWWEPAQDGPNTLVATPARHFSGRGLLNRNETLWCSWVIYNDTTRVYFGGDSGIMPQYEEIGDKYGPFDLAIMPIGAYDHAWHGIHIFPQEAVEAHLKLKAKKMLPVHWATFDLALHPWGEPMDHIMLAATDTGIEILTPEIGEKVSLDGFVGKDWWKGI